MLVETSDLGCLIRFLRDHTFSTVPRGLFDRYLWMYGDLEKAQHETVYSRRHDQLTFYALPGDPANAAIAAVTRRMGSLIIRADALDEPSFSALLRQLQATYSKKTVSMTMRRPEFATIVQGALRSEVSNGTTKYFTDREPTGQTVPSPAIEMTYKDEHYLTGIRPRRWPAYRQFLRQGVRFFGLINNGELKAMCGLTQITAFQSQIIGVETFHTSDRRKGYGKAVSMVALHEGLKQGMYVTWSTTLQNEPSCRTAESLGMKPYYHLYEVRGSFRQGRQSHGG